MTKPFCDYLQGKSLNLIQFKSVFDLIYEALKVYEFKFEMINKYQIKLKEFHYKESRTEETFRIIFDLTVKKSKNYEIMVPNMVKPSRRSPEV